MQESVRARASFAIFALVTAVAAPSFAADKDTDEARDQFKQGSSFAKDAQWGAALAAFERSAKLRPHPWTTYNIGVCERALGQYVRARRTFNRALSERKTEAELPEATVADIKRFISEIDGLTSTLDVTLAPADAAIAVDGQPLEADATAEKSDVPTVLAGTLPAGPGAKAPASRFRIVMDPGTHVLLITHEGFSDAIDTETVRPGEKRAIELSIAKLPATLDIGADRDEAVVTVNGIDVGVAPVRLSRPAGTYHVLVRKTGFIAYEADATLKPGQKTDLRAALKPEQPSIFKRWWFWTAAGVVVAGAATTTYLLTRPDPTRPPLDGGGLGWTVKLP
jgi:hypothetical protein